VRICLISREYPPDTGWGGIGAYTYQHARALKEDGHDVEVISLTRKEIRQDFSAGDDPQDSLHVPVHRAAWGHLLDELSTVWISAPYTHFALKSCLALWRKFLQVHSLKPFDVVEAPEHLAEALFPAITRICPLVVRLHTPHSKFIAERYHNLNTSFDQQLLAVVERIPILEADLLSSPSVDLAEYVAADTGVKLSAIAIVRNPVDCKKFCPEGVKAVVPDSRVTVFFAGRLEERKGVHYLIEAVPLILKECADVRFIIVGADTNTGPGGSSVLAALQSKLRGYGVESAVQFIKHVPLDEMPAHYRSADICVVPSLYENAPYTVLEAQASGKPVVGTAAGGSKEYIADGQSGFVVPARDAESLSAAIVKLVKDASLRQEMGRAARELSLLQFDRTVIVRAALASYEKAIAAHRSPADAALYKRSPEQSLADFVSLLLAYHKGLCDLIYRHSLTYRLKFWLQLAFCRPRLAAARVLLSWLKVLQKAGLAGAGLEALAARLESQVNERESEKDRLLLEQLMAACLLSEGSAPESCSRT
jgi:glycosyltransferase involved in cell wall biosynthesis